MDTGKIMMGTALLLITIGLLAHPAGAADTGTVIPGMPATGTADAGTLHGYCLGGSLPSTGSSDIATHPYERLTRSPAPEPYHDPHHGMVNSGLKGQETGAAKPLL
jgi:hypothetical protein